MKLSNIYTDIPHAIDEEFFEDILSNHAFTLKRIISDGQCTPEGEWYDQDENEWVVLLKGSAVLLIEGESHPVSLKPGDHILLPAHVRHRVERTSLDETTVWLALHYR